MPVPLPASFYDAPAQQVARCLLGCLMVHETDAGLTSGRIVEVEAYLATGDPANHAAHGRSERNAVMFGPPGRAYVYLIYGMHHCFNAVCGPVGVPEAILVRALEPAAGIELMSARRGTRQLELLTSGPARICQALGIDLRHNGADLTRGALYLSAGPGSVGRVARTARVGCPSTPGLRLRWYVRNSPFVSRRDPTAQRRGAP